MPRDVALLHGPTEDGKGTRMLRFKEGNVYAGEVRPVREGEPITSELVRLRPMHKEIPVCEVEVLHAPEAAAETRESDGPARVSSASYRRNWNAIFGAQPKKRAPTGGDFSVN